MARILVTGSTTGLGLDAASALLDDGHAVVLHARNAERAADVAPLAQRAAGVIVGDLSELAQMRSVAEQANALGSFDAVIHNAGIWAEPERNVTPDGWPRILAVNVLAPYVLTALIERPARLVYLSSGLHTGGRPSLDDVEWSARPWDGTQAYSDSKLLVTTLCAAIARRWADVRSNAVDPGWVPTRMGGPDAPDDRVLGRESQVMLAAGQASSAAVTGTYWYHGEIVPTAPIVHDVEFQERLLGRLAELTCVAMP